MSTLRECLKERSAKRRELLARQLGAGCAENLGLLLGNDKTTLRIATEVSMYTSAHVNNRSLSIVKKNVLPLHLTSTLEP